MVEMADRIARYREILLEDPQSRIYVPLADLLLKNGELEEALILLEDGLSRNPGHQAAMVVLGQTLLQAGRQNHGVKVLQRVLDLSPDNFVVLRTLAENFLHRDAFTHALPLLEHLVEIEPEQLEWPKLLADARDRLASDADKQPPAEEVAPDDANGDGLATMTLVDIMVAQGYVDKALTALQRMHENNPDRQDVKQRMDQLKAGLGRPEEPGGVCGNPGKFELPTGETRVKMRESQKKQFGEWINKLKSDEDHAS